MHMVVSCRKKTFENLTSDTSVMYGTYYNVLQLGGLRCTIEQHCIQTYHLLSKTLQKRGNYRSNRTLLDSIVLAVINLGSHDVENT
jgi:hypothetical protein